MSITPELEINTRLIIGPCQLVSIVEPEKLKIHLCVPFSNNNVNRRKIQLMLIFVYMQL